MDVTTECLWITCHVSKCSSQVSWLGESIKCLLPIVACIEFSDLIEVRPHKCGIQVQYSSNHPSPRPKFSVSSVIVAQLKTLRGNQGQQQQTRLCWESLGLSSLLIKHQKHFSFLVCLICYRFLSKVFLAHMTRHILNGDCAFISRTPRVK